MKKLNITWSDGIFDPTGYLFSFTKALGCAVKNSPYSEYAEDIVATSGFAFRMWVDGKNLCPSAMSIWDFDLQKSGVINGGLNCDYISRLWGEESMEEKRRLEAIEIIKTSIDNNIAAISWDIDACEWGLITGYDDENNTFATLSVSGEKNLLYDKLGKNEIPILSVMTITGINNKSRQERMKDTMKIAVNHANGREWCENEKGLAAYPALIKFLKKENLRAELSWNIEYYLGTYCALRYYAYKYFKKENEDELANLYKSIYENLKAAFDIKTSRRINDSIDFDKIREHVISAYEQEKKAILIMQN